MKHTTYPNVVFAEKKKKEKYKLAVCDLIFKMWLCGSIYTIEILMHVKVPYISNWLKHFIHHNTCMFILLLHSEFILGDIERRLYRVVPVVIVWSWWCFDYGVTFIGNASLHYTLNVHWGGRVKWENISSILYNFEADARILLLLIELKFCLCSMKTVLLSVLWWKKMKWYCSCIPFSGMRI